MDCEVSFATPRDGIDLALTSGIIFVFTTHSSAKKFPVKGAPKV
jgi:hypothetical protein